LPPHGGVHPRSQMMLGIGAAPAPPLRVTPCWQPGSLLIDGFAIAISGVAAAR
jgi:hypothetical protein